MTQTVTCKGDPRHFGYHEWRWFNSDIVPSWQTFGKGTGSLSVNIHRTYDGQPKTLVLHAAEYGQKSGREVMLSLDTVSLDSLINYLAINKIEALQKQRDELLAALKSMPIEWLEAGAASCKWADNLCIIMSAAGSTHKAKVSLSDLRAARAAITSAEANAS